MDRPKLRTVLIGFGRIAQGNAADDRMAKKMPFSTHAQVLREHPNFAWDAVVDPRPEARATAHSAWQISHTAATLAELPELDKYEVAVVATPPAHRPEVLTILPSLKGILIEKPLGTNIQHAKEFLDRCAKKSVAVQVNLLRRSDETTRLLRGSLLHDRVGKLQAVIGFYSHGLLNNGVHIIDLARMLLKEEVIAVQADGGKAFQESPIEGDTNLPFTMTFESGMTVRMNPLKLSCFRENGLEFWGEQGKLSYLHSGFSIMSQGIRESSLVAGEHELDLFGLEEIPSTLGKAFFEMYSNLADSIQLDEALLSPGVSALQTMEVIEAIVASAEQGGRVIECSKAGARS